MKKELIMKKMDKEQIIDIAEVMGFQLNRDQWNDLGWLRFELSEELDEQDMRWIWYKDLTYERNFAEAARILFMAGQKAKMKQLTNYITL